MWVNLVQEIIGGIIGGIIVYLLIETQRKKKYLISLLEEVEENYCLIKENRKNYHKLSAREYWDARKSGYLKELPRELQKNIYELYSKIFDFPTETEWTAFYDSSKRPQIENLCNQIEGLSQKIIPELKRYLM